MNKFDLLKSHIEAFTRKDGSVVAAHDDSRVAMTPKDASNQMKSLQSGLSKQGFKAHDDQHFLDGTSVDADKADHHHYMMKHPDGRKAIVYSHAKGDNKEVGVKHGGSAPSGVGAKYLNPAWG